MLKPKDSRNTVLLQKRGGCTVGRGDILPDIFQAITTKYKGSRSTEVQNATSKKVHQSFQGSSLKLPGTAGAVKPHAPQIDQVAFALGNHSPLTQSRHAGSSLLASRLAMETCAHLSDNKG